MNLKGDGIWGEEDRRDLERRQAPTRPWRRWLGPGRRAGGRREADQEGYVDVYTGWDVALVLGIFLLNVGDAFLTMLWLGRGGREANPIMDFLLDIGPSAFILQKCFLVGFWLLVLMVHKNFRLARVGLYASLVVYALLMVLHFAILALDVVPPNQQSHDASVPEMRSQPSTWTVAERAEIRLDLPWTSVSRERADRPETE